VSFDSAWLEGNAGWPEARNYGRSMGFLQPAPAAFPAETARLFSANNGLACDGDSARRAEKMIWPEVEPGPPPADKCASLDIVDLRGSRMRELFPRPMATRAPLDSVAQQPAGRVLAEPDSLLPLARGLLERGL
ncbi:unnamed protein product, partial [Prorocentrum cordatum]